MKNKLVLIFGLLCAVLLVIAASSCFSARRSNQARESEMVTRLDVEEKLSRFQQEKALLEEGLKAKEKELQDEKAALAATKSALMQEQLVNQSLKEDLEKMSRLKEKLEDGLKGGAKKAKR